MVSAVDKGLVHLVMLLWKKLDVPLKQKVKTESEDNQGQFRYQVYLNETPYHETNLIVQKTRLLKILNSIFCWKKYTK